MSAPTPEHEHEGSDGEDLLGPEEALEEMPSSEEFGRALDG